jgi:uncharacterized RDD family membrane protein YckC
MAKLLVHETAGVREFELVDAEVHIGRELDNALRLSDASISRHHASIKKTESGYEVQDMQSSNGVLVNGNRVQTMSLQDGDRITLGQVQITFVDPPPAENPLGTVRLNPSDMAKFQTAHGKPLLAEPSSAPEVPAAAAPHIPPKVEAPRPVPSQPVHNPAPGWLAGYLPPVPDDAKPTGERGDFFTRLLATLIDAAIPVVVMVAVWILQMVLLRSLASIVFGCLLGLIQFAFMVGYQFFFLPWCWVKFGASPGKKIMKLRIVPEDNPNGHIDVATAVLRIVGHLINGVLFGLPYLIILGAERKGLQDIISKSIVIKVDR